MVLYPAEFYDFFSTLQKGLLDNMNNYDENHYDIIHNNQEYNMEYQTRVNFAP